MKKTVTALLILSTLILSFTGVAAASEIGSGVDVVAENVKIIKSGILGRKITFNDADFKQGLCLTDFDKITITRLPKSTEGTLMMAGRRIGEGTTIKRKNLPSLVFIPASKEVTEATFGFTVDGQMGGAEIEFLIRFTDKVNYEPKLDDDYTETLSQHTQRDIKIFGKMCAVDDEGDALEYIVVSYPKSGLLTIVDNKTGEYLYTPHHQYTGTDSFVYVVRDEWGNFSTTETVNITVSERMSEVEYTDMTDRPEYNAAVAMSAMGIMGGRVLGDDVFFDPELTVTRAEFVAMAMKALGIKSSSIGATYFDDNDDIPTSLIGYVATAQKAGIVHGMFENGKLLFNPNAPITKYDAAMVMANLMGAKNSGDVPTFADESDIPVWARDSVYAMCSVGIFDYSDEGVDARATMTRADTAKYLYRMLLESDLI